jgi:hypothetical protein
MNTTLSRLIPLAMALTPCLPAPAETTLPLAGTWRFQLGWGINHYRFHSWCPPAAAFEATDELGTYLQAELPNKRSAFNAPDNKDAEIHNIDFLEVGTTEPDFSLYDYGEREGELIFRNFANSPSFSMLNEFMESKGVIDPKNGAHTRHRVHALSQPIFHMGLSVNGGYVRTRRRDARIQFHRRGNARPPGCGGKILLLPD